MPSQKLLTVQQAAERLGIHKQEVYRLVWTERIDWTNVGTGKKGRPRIRIPEQAVDAFIATNTRVAGAA